jgi:hypothetical protein
MKSLEELYNQTQPKTPSRRSLEDIYASSSGQTKIQPPVEFEQPLMGANTGLPKRIVSGVIEAPTAIGGGVMNAIRAGGRAVGMDTPAQPYVKNIFGDNVDPVGYRGGKELGALDTAIQGAAAVGETAFNFAPIGVGGQVIKTAGTGMKSWIPTVLKGSLQVAGVGFGAGATNELRESGDFSDALVEGGKMSLVGTPLGGSLAALGKYTNAPIVNALVKARKEAENVGDFARIAEIEAMPEWKSFTKANKLDDASVKARTDAQVTDLKNTLVKDFNDGKFTDAEFALNLQKDVDGEYAEALRNIVSTYDKTGNKMSDTVMFVQNMNESLQTLRKQIAEDISRNIDDPFKGITRQQLKNDFFNKLESNGVIYTPSNAAKFFDETYNNVTRKTGGKFSMEALDKLRLNANQKYDNTGQLADFWKALGMTSRDTLEGTIEALKQSNLDQDLLDILNNYKEINRLWSVGIKTEEAANKLTKYFNKRTSKLANMLGGTTAMVGTGNPLGYVAGAQLTDWAQQALTINMKNKMLKGGTAASVTDLPGTAIRKGAPTLLTKLADRSKSKVEENNKLKELLKIQEENRYKADSELPTIDMGAGKVEPSSKVKRAQEADSKLPSIDYSKIDEVEEAKAIRVAEENRYKPDSELPVIDFGNKTKKKTKQQKADSKLPVIKSLLGIGAVAGASKETEASTFKENKNKEELAKIDSAIEKITKESETIAPMISRKYIKTLVDQESSLGRNELHRTGDEGKYGWVVGFTKDTWEDINKKAKTSKKWSNLRNSMPGFETPEDALKSAIIYSQFLLRDHTKEQLPSSTGKEWKNISAAELYKLYNGGGNKRAKEDFESRWSE